MVKTVSSTSANHLPAHDAVDVNIFPFSAKLSMELVKVLTLNRFKHKENCK